MEEIPVGVGNPDTPGGLVAAGIPVELEAAPGVEPVLAYPGRDGNTIGVVPDTGRLGELRATIVTISVEVASGVSGIEAISAWRCP